MTTDTIVTLLRWAVPLAFACHVVEEFIWPGGFIAWYHGYRPQIAGAAPSYYYKANACYFAATLTVPLVPASGCYGLLFTSALLLNNLIFTHIRGAIKTRRHSPGLVTGCLLYIPLFAASYSYVLSHRLVTVPEALACLALSPLSEVYFALKRDVPATRVATARW